MKDDVETPPRPPKKRRALEAADARHLAIWATDESLPSGDRQRAQDERDRRKQLRTSVAVGVLVGTGGATAEQIERLQSALESVGPTEIHHPFTPGRVHAVCRATGARVAVYRGSPEMTNRQVAQASDVLIGIVSENSIPIAKTGVWDSLRYAKDRGIDVITIWPSGLALEGRW